MCSNLQNEDVLLQYDVKEMSNAYVQYSVKYFQLMEPAMEGYYSSDDEVLYGPITKKDIKKTLKLRRRTKVYEPMAKCGNEIQDDIFADKEEAWQNLTFMVQPSRPEGGLMKTWHRRSLDIQLACEVNNDDGHAETPAPPPSPEFSRYNGSPYPTPCRTRRQLCNSLREIAEEEDCPSTEVHSTPERITFFPRYSDNEQFGEWRDTHTPSYSSVDSNESLSILSELDDNLVEQTSILSLSPTVTRKEAVDPSVTSETEGDACWETQGMSEDERKTRRMLIDQMKQHEERTQQLKNTKKQTTDVPEVCETPLSETSNDVIILNDVENEFSLDDDSPASPEIEILCEDNLEVSSSGFESTGGNFQLLKADTCSASDKPEHFRFSRLISERDIVSPVIRTEGNHDSVLAQSIFLGDLERRYGREKVDQALAALGSQPSEVGTGTARGHELDDTCTTRARPPSPEFDIELPEQKTPVLCDFSYSCIAGEYSLISEADDCVEEISRDKSEPEALDSNCAVVGNTMVSADEDGGFLSVLSEAAMYHASMKYINGRGDNVGLAEHTDMYPEGSHEESHLKDTSAAVVQRVNEECHDVGQEESYQPLCETSDKFGREEEEAQEYEESSGICLRNADVDKDDNSMSVVEQRSVLDSNIGLHARSCCREMDATSDLNDSDRRNIEDMENLESFSEEEGFHDTLEEMEMFLKFGIDYVTSGNDHVLSDPMDKKYLCHSVSTPKKPFSEMSGFEDFGDAFDQVDHHHLTNGAETDINAYGESEACPPELLYSEEEGSKNKQKTDILGAHSSCTDGRACGSGETVAISQGHGSVFPKPQTTPLKKFHNKLHAGVSPTMNMKLCQSAKIDKPSPFKMPVKPVLQGAHITKPGLLRSVKKSPLKPITMASPCKKPFNYNNIVSPVGAYIHNTPSPSLVTLVKPKLSRATTPKRTVAVRGTPTYDSMAGTKKHLEVPYRVEEKGRENVDTSNVRPVLPLVSYESVPSVKLEESLKERMPRLNEKMKKLVDTPRPRVIRHEGRVKVAPNPKVRSLKVTSAKKLVTNCDDSYMASSDADGEISVVVGKQVTRTNTLGF